MLGAHQSMQLTALRAAADAERWATSCILRRRWYDYPESEAQKWTPPSLEP
jgi:hypothetical protein